MHNKFNVYLDNMEIDENDFNIMYFMHSRNSMHTQASLMLHLFMYIENNFMYTTQFILDRDTNDFRTSNLQKIILHKYSKNQFNA